MPARVAKHKNITIGFNVKRVHVSFNMLDDPDKSGSCNENIQCKMKLARRKFCTIVHFFLFSS